MQGPRRRLSVRIPRVCVCVCVCVCYTLFCTIPCTTPNNRVGGAELRRSECHSWRGSYPKREADLTVAGLLPSALGVLAGNCTLGPGAGSGRSGDGQSVQIELPGYSIVSISL